MAGKHWDNWREPTPKDEGLILIFGAQVYSAATECLEIHPDQSDPLHLTVGTIPDGSRCTCARCHQSGRDGSPKLRIQPEDRKYLAGWAPEEPDGYEVPAEPTVFAGQEKPGGVGTKGRRRIMKQFQRKKAKSQAPA